MRRPAGWVLSLRKYVVFKRSVLLAAVSGLIGIALVLGLPALALNIVGTKGNDVLRGTPRTDKINGRAGNDRILGLAGNDTLTGGPGRDFLDGGAGDDRLLIRDGARDTATCGPGRDRVTADTADVVRANCETVLRPTPPPPPPPPAACSNGRDDDGDGKIDYPADPGCADSSDTDETDPLPPPVVVTSGSYKGLLEGNFLFFDVLPDRTVTHFRSNYIRKDCDLGGYVYGTLNWGETRIPIEQDGSFQFSATQSGTVSGLPATFTWDVAGQFAGTEVTGTLLGTSEFDYQGRHFKCSSGRRTWAASLQP